MDKQLFAKIKGADKYFYYAVNLLVTLGIVGYLLLISRVIFDIFLAVGRLEC